MLWRIYFWVVLGITVIRMWFMGAHFFKQSWYVGLNSGFYEYGYYVHLLFGVAAVVGLHGAVFARPYGEQLVWRIFAPAYIAYELFWSILSYNIRIDYAGSMTWAVLMTVFSILGLILLIPLFIALVQYAYKHDTMWPECAAKEEYERLMADENTEPKPGFAGQPSGGEAERS